MQFHPSLPSPFSLSSGSSGLAGRLASLAASALDPLLGLSALDRLYSGLPAGNFVELALGRLGIAVDVAASDLANVPAHGAVLVVANHPTGAADGLALAHALMRRRTDIRILGNRLLTRIPEMRQWTIAVDPFDPRSAANRQGLRAARDWLASGGLLVVFPAGAVSSLSRAGSLVDQPWHQGVARLARWSRATVVPTFIDARPSLLFRLAGVAHPRLRTLLLPRELLRLRNRPVGVHIGTAVTEARLAACPNPAAVVAYLRARTYALEKPAPAKPRAPAPAPIARAIGPEALVKNIAALSPASRLLSSGPYDVFYSAAADLPAVLPEIGRLRELAFRGVGEGTGRATDLDAFDQTYHHLFVWQRDRGQVVGGYRVGATDLLCPERGPRGLYTHTLFRLSSRFLDRLGPALELGRSFVRAEYQRDSLALLLLWKGIGTLVARAPRYRHLFGPLSISADYSRASRGVMQTFLAADGADDPLRPLVTARRPISGDEDAVALLRAAPLRRFEEVDALVGELEGGRGVPVLLRQYWKLNARVLAFSVDHAFGGALDGLMVVDLAKSPAAALTRYLGRDGAAAFAVHQATMKMKSA